MKRFVEVGESYLFFIRGIIDKVPDNKRENFKSELVAKLRDYKFKKRSRADPPHSNSVKLREKDSLKSRNYNNPGDVFDAIITQMNPYYVAETQNRIKRYIEENL